MTERHISHPEGLPACAAGHSTRHIRDQRGVTAGGGHLVERRCRATSKHAEPEAALAEWRRINRALRAPGRSFQRSRCPPRTARCSWPTASQQHLPVGGCLEVAMGAAEKLDLSGNDWLTFEEAAHYCGVSNSQFRKNALNYGLTPRRFMGKQLYEKAARYAAIQGAEEWQRFDSTGVAARPTSIGQKEGSAFAGLLGNLMPVRRREFVPRKKPS